MLSKIIKLITIALDKYYRSFYFILFFSFFSIPVPITTYHDLGGFGCSDILKKMSAVHYLANMIGRYRGLDALQQPNIQIKIVSPGCESQPYKMFLGCKIIM